MTDTSLQFLPSCDKNCDFSIWAQSIYLINLYSHPPQQDEIPIHYQRICVYIILDRVSFSNKFLAVYYAFLNFCSAPMTTSGILFLLFYSMQ